MKIIAERMNHYAATDKMTVTRFLEKSFKEETLA